MIVNDDSFKKALEDCTTPILADFSAIWCGPCRALSPILDEIEEEFKDKILVLKCDVEDCPEAASDYNIRSIPCLIYMDQNGNEIKRTIGLQSKAQIEAVIKEII